ncbi:MAG: AraC family transcriptional regulator [Rhodobacteraceae bacterium HLUCCA08]|nr:MAG: AraC family transcriptional regulator [Rhodobacteraceae bacterium HLUCCA08]
MTDPALSLPAATASHVVTRAELATRRPRGLHRQDFHELIWVQNGRVRHHLPDGPEDLAEGDLVFVTPDHSHALQGRGAAAMVVSVAIRAAVIDALGARHEALSGHGFWAGTARPARAHRDMRQLAGLNQAALRLERGPDRALELEAFLLPLMTDLVDATPPLPEDAPDWLARALAAARDPRVFRDGAAGLARAAGRAHPHVSRTLRRYLDQTPSDYVNARRMDHAARRLVGSADTLAEIAAECGIPNLSHFHKLFLAHHGQTPQRYRRDRQKALVQP